MLGLLRAEGPATATTLAPRLGLNTGATSYHLRQLAQHGFIVEDAERGNARDRWWRAAHQSTRTRPARPATRGRARTLEAYLQTVALLYTERCRPRSTSGATCRRSGGGVAPPATGTLRLTPAPGATQLVEAPRPT